MNEYKDMSDGVRLDVAWFCYGASSYGKNQALHAMDAGAVLLEADDRDRFPDFLRGEEAVREEDCARLMEFLFSDGMHPAEVVRRLYVVAGRLLGCGGVVDGGDLVVALRGDRGARVAMVGAGCLDAVGCDGVLAVAMDEGRIRWDGGRRPLAMAEIGGLEGRAAVVLLGFFFAGDASPGLAMRRVYGVAKGWWPELIGGAALEVLGGLLDETRQTVSKRLIKLWDRFRRVMGSHALVLPYQKSVSAVEVYRVAAGRGWRTRRGRLSKLGGGRMGRFDGGIKIYEN